MNHLDPASLLAIIHQFQKWGLFLNQKDTFTIEQILSTLKIVTQYGYVIRRWLKILTKNEYLLSERETYRYTGISITEQELQKEWKKARKLWDHRLGSPLISLYFFQNVEALSALMNRQQRATTLLFPEGKNDVANALYRESLIDSHLNEQVSNEVVKIAKTLHHKIYVLEVGAGTGSTANVVIKKIKNSGLSNKIESYLFTDLSPFFFREPNSVYKNDPWVKTKLVDLEKDLQAGTLEEGTIYIIIAAGVLNNVSNIVSVLKGLRNLLTQGGILLITEADGEAIQILISQIFMMEAAGDARKQSDTTFMDRVQWQEAFKEAKLKLLRVTPDSGHKLERFGQKLFMLTH